MTLHQAPAERPVSIGNRSPPAGVEEIGGCYKQKAPKELYRIFVIAIIENPNPL